MANRTEDVVTKPAEEAATKLERAVRTNDKAGYDNAMTEVNQFRKSHTPEENKAYTAAITKKFEDDKVLPAVSLFEVQRDFKKIDTSENGRLERGELDNYKHRDDVNELQRNLIGHVQKNYDQVRNISRYGENWHGGNSDAIADQDINDGVKESQAQMNLYAPNKDGKAFIDKLADKDGNIPHGTIANLLALDKAHPGQYLSPEDKRTLEDIQSKRSWYSRIPFTDDASASRLAGMATVGDINQRQLEQQPTNSRIESPTPAPKPEPAKAEVTKPGAPPTDAQHFQEAQRARQEAARKEQAEKQEGDRKEAERKEGERKESEKKQEELAAQIKEALKIQGKNQSYSHAAERLLALAGNADPSGKEIRELSHQLWVAHGRHKAGSLAVGDVLTMDDAIKHNPSLKKLFAPQG